MNMKILKKEKRLCTCCMNEHEVQFVQMREQTTFKSKNITYNANYMYCDIADEYYVDEHQMQENDINLKNAYRREVGLLTSDDIVAIRTKYGITQSDLCTLLGWGGKTVTRYESHQVQDRAHDVILKKLDQDPEWFLMLLKDAKESLGEDAYKKYCERASHMYEAYQKQYLIRAVGARCAGYQDYDVCQEGKEALLDRLARLMDEYCSVK